MYMGGVHLTALKKPSAEFVHNTNNTENEKFNVNIVYILDLGYTTQIRCTSVAHEKKFCY